MLKYAFSPKPEKSAKAYGQALRISQRNALPVCRAISGLPLEKGRKLLKDLLEKKRSLNGKYYTKTVKEILKLLESAASNAEFKGLDPKKLIIYASAHKGFTFHRPRKFKMGRQRRKVANVQIVLIQK